MTMCFTDNSPKFVRRLLEAAATALTSSMVITLPVISAEKIYFDYGYLGRAISTSSLEAFVENGTVDGELAPYLSSMSDSDRQGLQQLLSTPLLTSDTNAFGKLSHPFVVSQWLQSPIGDLMLAKLGTLIQTQGRHNGHQAIRAAIVSAAASPNGLSVLSAIRLYPTEGIRINLSGVLSLFRSIGTVEQATEQLMNTAVQQSEAAAELEPSIDYSSLPVLSDVAQFRVTKQSIVLKDKSRIDLQSSQENRTFVTDLYLPDGLHTQSDSDSTEPVPVMVISHGYGDNRHLPDTVSLARSLAANGFAVAVPEHVGSNRDYRSNLSRGLSQESFTASAFVDRPLDITFLLDTLEQKNSRQFQGRLQLDRVGVIGRSLGGYTALAVAGATIDLERLQSQCAPETELTPDTIHVGLLLQCRLLELENSPQAIQQLVNGSLKDKRIALVVASAPLTNLFGPHGISQIDVPVVITGGTHDIVSPIVLEQMRAFQWLQTAQKYFYLAENTAHTPEMSSFILNLVHPQSDIVDRFDQAERELFKLTVSLAIAHGKVHLLDDESYQPYLTSAYVKTVSPDPTRLHLLRDIPAEN